MKVNNEEYDNNKNNKLMSTLFVPLTAVIVVSKKSRWRAVKVPFENFNIKINE